MSQQACSQSTSPNWPPKRMCVGRYRLRQRIRTYAPKAVWGASLMVVGLLWQPVFCPVVCIPSAVAQTVPMEVGRAYNLLGKGLVNDAIAGFKEALRRYPQSLPAQLGLAIAYRRSGRDAEALQAYERVLDIDPNNQLALKTIGLLGGYRSQWQQRGIEALNTLLNTNPGDTESRAQRALLYGYQGRYPEALADYEIVLQTNSAPDILLGAGQIYTYTGKYQQGIELFNRYRSTGKSITGYPAIAYARALRETGNPGQAVQVLEAQLPRLNKFDDQAVQTRVELAQAYIANQQPDAALPLLQPLRGRPDATLPLARTLNEIGRRTNQPNLSQEAATLYRQALSSTPNPSPKLVREVADVLSGVPGEQQYSLQLYRQLAQQQPGDKSLSVQQLALENQLGLLTNADLKQRLRTLVEPLPTDPFQKQVIASALVRLDPPDPELLPVYQSLASPDVNQPFLNFRIAQIFIQRNDLISARRALETYKATPEGSKDQAPELVLAEIDRREGKLEASAKRYQTIIASKPADKDILNGALRGLAGIRLTQNRPDDALAVYDQLSALNPNDLTIKLGRTNLAYQTRRISEAQAEAVLNNWIASQPATARPPELFSLVGALPPNPQRESLYNSLLEVDPNNIPVQLRLIQVIAARNPAQARARVARLITQDPNNIGAYFVQGELAQAIGDSKLAEQAYQSILAKQPNNTDALSAIGGLRFKERRFDEATKIYNQVLTIKPEDKGARRALAGLNAVQDRPIEALRQLEELQLEQMTSGGPPDGEMSRQRQQIQEDFLRRRGFQPPWERY